MQMKHKNKKKNKKNKDTAADDVHQDEEEITLIWKLHWRAYKNAQETI